MRLGKGSKQLCCHRYFAVTGTLSSPVLCCHRYTRLDTRTKLSQYEVPWFHRNLALSLYEVPWFHRNLATCFGLFLIIRRGLHNRVAVTGSLLSPVHTLGYLYTALKKVRREKTCCTKYCGFTETSRGPIFSALFRAGPFFLLFFNNP